MAALQTLRGMALVKAATLIAELGDLSPFTDPRQLMAYLGLVPSEHSSGASVKRGSITKVGNSAARRLLIEAAWCYRFSARVSRRIVYRASRTNPSTIRDIAWKGIDFRNGPLGVKPPSDDLATVIVLPSVVDTRAATSCHQMGAGEPISNTGSCLWQANCRSNGFTGSASR